MHSSNEECKRKSILDKIRSNFEHIDTFRNVVQTHTQFGMAEFELFIYLLNIYFTK